ncbi:hypothetical protein [Candidatus Paracaedibacter symbiosus]|uniref:hypothetical protein n=1 Tax=Candidatus Paracaedibacter symbiosus TaxID=244582 RepID=UPI00050986E3|nr:hypothetical protein [Candidatus Paracaedibacter symbiosus]
MQKKLNSLYKEGREYTILDFRSFEIDDNIVKELSTYPLVELQADKARECLIFLKAPLFKTSVKKVIPICKDHALIIFLKNEDKDNVSRRREPFYPTLDLHGKASIALKCQWINDFVKKFSSHKMYAIEIITGRGLHNPKGEMGVLWSSCGRYLLSKKLQPYIHAIYPINKEGGWKIILKGTQYDKIVKNKKGSFHKTLNFYGTNPPFKNPKLITIPSDQTVKLTSTAKLKRPKKGLYLL